MTKRSYFNPTHKIPRSYGVQEVADLLGWDDPGSFHSKDLKSLIRRYAFKSRPRYDAEDVEDLARKIAWLRYLINAGKLPPNVNFRIADKLKPPEDFVFRTPASIREKAVPPSYTVQGVAARWGFEARSSVYNSGLLDLVRSYETSYRTLHDAEDVLAVRDALRRYGERERVPIDERKAYVRQYLKKHHRLAEDQQDE